MSFQKLQPKTIAAAAAKINQVPLYGFITDEKEVQKNCLHLLAITCIINQAIPKFLLVTASDCLLIMQNNQDVTRKFYRIIRLLPFAMKVITNREQPTIMALLAGAVLIIGINTYSTGFGGPLAAYAAAQTSTDVEKISVDFETFVQGCAAGAGEIVHLTGEVQALFHMTFDNADGVHIKVQYSHQGISGTGLTTGDKYQLPGVTQGQFNAKVGLEAKIVNNFPIISQGNGDNLVGHLNFLVTVHPDGTVTALVEHVRVECK